MSFVYIPFMYALLKSSRKILIFSVLILIFKICVFFVIRLKVEGPQGGGELEDDTAANDVEFKCTKGEVISSTNGGKLGSWGEWSSTCPTGFCGIETKVELLLDAGGDDTALNDVRFMCGC